MIHRLKGELRSVSGNHVLIDVGGVTLKATMPVVTLSKLPGSGQKIEILTHLHIRESGIDLYGFISEEELAFFEALISVSGIGPKSAIGILSVAPIGQLRAAISTGRAELLQKSSGVGRKTAERIVLELKDKLIVSDDEETVEIMQSDRDVIEALVGLGYSRTSARGAVLEIDSKLTLTADRLRDALQKVRK